MTTTARNLGSDTCPYGCGQHPYLTVGTSTVDTSIFPSIGAVNPALTAMANSLRVGDHLLERLA